MFDSSMLDLHISHSSGFVRFILRFYFTVLVFFLNLVGDRCCRLAVRNKLLRRRTVKVSHMTGWLPDFAPIWMFWEIRSIPGGWMGLLMILSAILALCSDWAVSGLVHTDFIPGRCAFERGVRLSKDPTNSSTFPTYNGQAYYWANAAQLTSYNNSGSLGIYSLIDNNTAFRASGADLLGYWQCETASSRQSYDTTYNWTNIIHDLEEKSALYPVQGQQYNYWYTDIDDPFDFQQMVVWTSSTPGYAVDEADRAPFDIRVAVEVNAGQPDIKYFDSYACTVHGRQTDYIHGILEQINATQTLVLWSSLLQGNVYAGIDSSVYENANTLIEVILNNMVMVSGGLQRISAIGTGDESIGCLVPTTLIPKTVVAVFLIVTFFFVALFCYMILLWFRTLSARSARDGASGAGRKEISKDTPNGLAEWMAFALRVSKGPYAQNAHAKNLRSWTFTADHDGARLGFVRKGETMLSPGIATSPNFSTPYMSSGFQPSAQKGYTYVHTTEL